MTIGKGVTSIGASAFSSCTSLKNVAIPNGVTYIGEMAFYYCKALQEVTIPDSVKRIGKQAFGYCDSLTKASIPETFEDFKADIFDGSEALSFKRGLTVRRLAGSQNYVERVKNYRLEASLGIAVAQYELGMCYCKGKGVNENIVEAAKWWRKAANQNHAEAQFQLGCLYYMGDGVDENGLEAVNLWRKAAAQGHASSLCNLGIFYMEGREDLNIPRDRIEGLRLLRMAMEKGSVKARDILWRMKWESGNRLDRL